MPTKKRRLRPLTCGFDADHLVKEWAGFAGAQPAAHGHPEHRAFSQAPKNSILLHRHFVAELPPGPVDAAGIEAKKTDTGADLA